MKQDKTLTALTAALLAFAASWGTLGCLTSGLGLPVEVPGNILLVCGAAALSCGVLFSFSHGGLIFGSLLALLGGYLYRDGRAAQQLLAVVHHLSVIYDRAYGWGVFLPELAGDGFGDFPLGILGLVIAGAVCWSVCRGGSVWLPVLAMILPLCSCIVVTDTVPGELWLLMVLFSLILLILTTSVRRENAVQGLRLTLGASLPVLAGLLCLFLAIPQKNYVNYSEEMREQILSTVQSLPRRAEVKMAQLVSQLQIQPPKQVDLANLGERFSLDYAVMEVTAEHGGTLYLREQDYDGYDGRGWTASPDRQERFPGSGQGDETISIRYSRKKALKCLPYYPAEETLLTGGGAASSGEESTIRRSLLPEDWRQRAYGGSGATPEGLSRYLALPEATRQAGQTLLADLLPTNTSNTEKADILAAFVTNSAQYDLVPSTMPPGEADFALWFLREGERGYCVHFATAATVLLRSAGIPARYVTGYLLEAVPGQTVTVTEENAHAWAEYYEPNLGLWLPLESTPAQALPEIPVERPEMTEATEPPQTTVPETLAELPTQTVPEPPAATEPPPVETLPEVPEALPVLEESAAFPWAVLLLPVCLLLPAVQRSIRLGLRRRRQRTGQPNHQGLHRWREAVRLARLLGESPPEELEILAQKAKFSQHDLTAEELQQFDGFCRSCQRRLREKPWYLQWLYQYIYAIY